MDGLGLYVRSPLLIDKTVLDRAPLQCFYETKDCRVVKPENWVSRLNSRTGLGLYVWSPKTMSEMTKLPCGKKKKKNVKIFSRFWETFKLFCKKGCMCSIVERPFFSIKNQFVTARLPRRWVQALDKSPIMTPIQSGWMVNSGN